MAKLKYLLPIKTSKFFAPFVQSVRVVLVKLNIEKSWSKCID